MEGKKSPPCVTNEERDNILQFDGAVDSLESSEVLDWLDEFSRQVAEKTVGGDEYINTKGTSSYLKTVKLLKNTVQKNGKAEEKEWSKNSTFVKPDSNGEEANESSGETTGSGFTVNYMDGAPISPSDFDNRSQQKDTKSHDKNLCIYKTPRSRNQEIQEKVIVEVETTPKKVRTTPLPLLKWADNEEIWQNIVYKEEATMKLRNVQIFDTRSAYLPRMRAILLDWIMEVCEVYHLRRNTYYLAVDYIDRYLTIKPSVPKTQLQLLGISCLFIAAKLDEIYPPKLSEFSYVCDGACTEEEILSCEILLLNALGWEVNPLTPSGWLNLYMQIHHNSKDIKAAQTKLMLNNKATDPNFQYPQYSGYQFVCASHLMDLFSMDPSFLRFSYSTIAAASMYFVYGKASALAVSGLKWKSLSPCVQYMSTFHRIISTTYDPRLTTVQPDIEDERLSGTIRYIRNTVPKIINDENHCVQTHLMDLDYFEKSIVLRIEQLGINVGKVFVRKIKTESGEIEYETTEDSTEQVPPCVMMYELSPAKENMGENSNEDLPPLHPTDPDYELGKVNIFSISQKTIVTFDDILASLHNDFPYPKIKKLQNKNMLNS